MKIAFGCDHRGIDLKRFLLDHIAQLGHSSHDFGAFNTDAMDYPDVARPVGEAVARGDFDVGVLICNTGIGMSIAANKVPGIRAALCHNVFYAERARLHNDANILCLGTVFGDNESREILDAFLSTAFEGGRHARRLDKIKAIENGC